MSCNHVERSYLGDCEECAAVSALAALVPEGFTLAELLACVGRELRLRRRVYPGWVARGRLKQETADREIRTMQAVKQLLENLDGRTAESRAQGALFGGSR